MKESKIHRRYLRFCKIVFKAFSSNKEFTIVTKDVRYLGTVGSRRQGPTFYDVMQVNKEYCASKFQKLEGIV